MDGWYLGSFVYNAFKQLAEQPLLPEELRGRRFYEPTGRGFEAELGRRLAALRERLGG